MKSSKLQAERKSPSRRIDNLGQSLKAASALVALLLATTTWAGAIPLPKPRPSSAPHGLVEPSEPAGQSDQEKRPVAQSEASACRLALSDTIAIAPSIPAISGPGGCGGDDLVRLEAVVLADSRRVALKPAATMRCEMAAAVAAWLREDIAPLVDRPERRLHSIDNADSFSCRGRNRVAGAKLSEHGRANAFDIRALRFEAAAPIVLYDRATPRDLRQAVLASLCARFTTVLGPGSDGYHEDHIHLDLAQRRSGYRICQWTIEEEGQPKMSDSRVIASAAPSAAASATRQDAAAQTALQADPASPSATSAIPLPRPRPVSASIIASAPTAQTQAIEAKQTSAKQTGKQSSTKSLKRRTARRAPPKSSGRSSRKPWPLSLIP